MIRVPVEAPVNDEGVEKDEWMHLHEAVRWVAWKGTPEPKFGSTTLADGNWVDFGDREERDQRRVNDAARQVRLALASGKVIAWGQRGWAAPLRIDAAYWAYQFSNVVSDLSMRFDGLDKVLLERISVMKLWPASVSAKGRPTEHDWDLMRALATAAIEGRPEISRGALARSLVPDYADRGHKRVPSVRQIEKNLAEWGLPPSK